MPCAESGITSSNWLFDPFDLFGLFGLFGLFVFASLGRPVVARSMMLPISESRLTSFRLASFGKQTP